MHRNTLSMRFHLLVFPVQLFLFSNFEEQPFLCSCVCQGLCHVRFCFLDNVFVHFLPWAGASALHTQPAPVGEALDTRFGKNRTCPLDTYRNLPDTCHPKTLQGSETLKRFGNPKLLLKQVPATRPLLAVLLFSEPFLVCSFPRTVPHYFQGMVLSTAYTRTWATNGQ